MPDDNKPDENKREGFEIDEDMAFQRRQWVAERIGWACMALTLLAALAGLLGPGPLSRAVAGREGSAISVHYDRFPRHSAMGKIKVVLGPGAAKNGEARVWVSRDFFDANRVHEVIPEPDRVEASRDRYTYVFRVGDAAQRATAVFQLEPDGYGKCEGRVGLEGGPEVALRQFVYP
jgi:hypothetical protein